MLETAYFTTKIIEIYITKSCKLVKLARSEIKEKTQNSEAVKIETR